MKYLIVGLLLFHMFPSFAQVSFTTPIGADYRSITLIINNANREKSMFIYNDLKHDPINLVLKKDTVVNAIQLIRVNDPLSKTNYFLRLPTNYDGMSLYDKSFKLIANLSNDSYSFRTQLLPARQKPKTVPNISADQLVKLFMLLL